jgi:hypothetical protein
MNKKTEINWETVEMCMDSGSNQAKRMVLGQNEWIESSRGQKEDGAISPAALNVFTTE